MKVILSGGGSGGPVSPVLAVAQEIKKLKPRTQFLFVGSTKGPERAMVEAAQIDFVGIRAAKLRRYFSIKNFFDVFVFITSLIKAYKIVKKFQPDVIFSAGGFVAVPVIWMGKLLGCKVVIHQQDARIGLANKLSSPCASKITTAFEYTAKKFYSGSGLLNKKNKPRAEWVGNPVRTELLKEDKGVDVKKYFGLHEELPVLLVLGGATGAAQINELVKDSLEELTKAHQIVHQTGEGKNNIVTDNPNYHAFELIPFKEYAAILRKADIVVARAGLSTIAELSALRKVAIIIPMPYSHQEDNAKILKLTASSVVLEREEVTPETLTRVIVSLKFNPKRTEMLTKNISMLLPQDAATHIAQIIIKEVNDK